MRVVLREIFRIWKKNPFGISGIWLLDLFEAILLGINPFVIGLCIDGLLEKDYSWFIGLIIVELLYLVSHTINIFFDTRIYSVISKEEHDTYYSQAIISDLDDSKINARLEWVDDGVEFLETGILNIFKTFVGIISSLIYLFRKSYWFVFGAAILFTVIVPVATNNIRKKINDKIEKGKDLDEDTQNQIASRNNDKYINHTSDIAKINVSISDLDTALFLIKRICRILILIIVIVATIRLANVTEGLLFATITYAVMLCEYIDEIDEIHIEVSSLEGTICRLKGM